MNWISGGIKRSQRWIPFVFTCCFTILAIYNPPIIDESIETLLVDYRFKVRNLISPPKVPEDIVVVAIDEPSLMRFGRWPWNRELQAKLIKKISSGNPRVVAVDIFYSEPESQEADTALADAMQYTDTKIALALSFEVEEGRGTANNDEDVLFEHAIMRVENQSYIQSIKAHRVLLPPAPIDSATQFGHVYVLPDRDGKLRSEPLYLKFGDDYIPSLSLLTASYAMQASFESISIQGNRGVMLNGQLLGTDVYGRLYINYYGKEGSFPYISAAHLLDDEYDPSLLVGKVVLIGTSAIATYDQKSTPFSANMPGVEKNATVVANILYENYLVKCSRYFDVLIVIAAGIATMLISRRYSSVYSFLAFFFLTGLILSANQFCFSQFGLLLNLTYPMMTATSCGLFILGHKYFIEERSARQIKGMFSSYVTERVVTELVRNPEIAKLGGQRRELSILFSDIRGFTSFSEKNEPEFVVEMLNEYLEAMTDIVFHWEGTLDKFVGDAIVAFWSAPVPQEDHAERALRCSLHMLQKLEGLQGKWRSEGREVLDIGIGLNTGEVLVGNIGAEAKKMDYTIIGDHVNLCARVESLTKDYNAQLIITEHILEHVRGLLESDSFGHMVITELEKVTVKGKVKPVSVYEMRRAEKGSKSKLIEKLAN